MQALQHGPVVIQTNIKDKAKFAACNAMPVLVNRPLPDEDGRIQKVAEVHLNRYPSPGAESYVLHKLLITQLCMLLKLLLGLLSFCTNVHCNHIDNPVPVLLPLRRHSMSCRHAMVIMAHAKAGEPIQLNRWWKGEMPVFEEDTFVIYNSWVTDNQVQTAWPHSTGNNAHMQCCSLCTVLSFTVIGVQGYVFAPASDVAKYISFALRRVPKLLPEW